MAIYCNTLEGNMQYSNDPYCFTPSIRYRYMMVTLNTTLVIIGKMEAEKFTVYCNTELEPAATKRVAKALVDCKVCISIHMAKLHWNNHGSVFTPHNSIFYSA